MASSTLPSLVQSSPIARVITQFLRWWRNELASLIPEKLRNWWVGDNKAILLHPEAEYFSFELISADQRETILKIPRNHGARDAAAKVLPQQISERIGKGDLLWLSLPETAILQRTLMLPLATEENLLQTLTFELDRLTPFRPAEVYFDFCIRHRDSSRQIIEVDLAIAKRTDVDSLKNELSTLGLFVRGVAYNGKILGGATTTLWGHPDMDRPTRRTWVRAVLILATLTLSVALLGSPIWQKRVAAIALLKPLAELREAAKASDASREQLEKLIVEHNTLPEKKWASPSLTQVIEELSLRLKDDTYVLNLGFDGKSVVLQGESASAAELVEGLDASPLFHNVEFKSPITKLPSSNHDRFHIKVDISPDGMLQPPGAVETVKP